MPDLPDAPFVRADAVAVNVYNDGHYVYLYDKSSAAELERLIASGEHAGTSPQLDLHRNLQSPSFAQEVAARGLILIYELDQDDPVSVEIGVGSALTQGELGKGCWLKSQSGYLHLPAGHLRIESPNSLSLTMAESIAEPTDEGASIHLPAGQYKVTLHRTDWDAVHREGIEDYAGPGEFILLTPVKKPPAKAAKSPILPYIAPVDPTTWRGAFSVDGKTFTAQVKSGYWWTPIRCNLDREAVGKLGLEVGSFFELKVFNLNIVALYLGDTEYQGVYKTLGEERYMELQAKFPEFAIAHWGTWTTYGGAGTKRWEECEELLTLERPDGLKAYPAKGHELWVEATGRVLDQGTP